MPTGAEVDRRRSSRRPGSRCASACPGVHNLALWEALRESPIRLVGVRHEQAAAYAADGYARASGKLGVALTTTGPGRGEHARRGRRGVGVAHADPRDRDRHPDDAAAAGRLPRRAARDERAGGDVPAGDARPRSCVGDARQLGSLPPSIARSARRPVLPRGADRPARWPRSRPTAASGRLRAGRDRARRPVPADRRRRAAADLGRLGRARPRRRGAGARRAARRAGPDHLRRARRAAARASAATSACRRTCRPPAGSGTTPTW